MILVVDYPSSGFCSALFCTYIRPINQSVIQLTNQSADRHQTEFAEAHVTGNDDDKVEKNLK